MPIKVTSNGRITIPKRVREYLGIEPGTGFAFRRAVDGSVVIERADGNTIAEPFCQIAG